jgi:hypothetical protein
MAQSIKAVTSARSTYPWHLWAAGGAWVVSKGEDFECSTEGFRSTLQSHADRNGLTVKASIRGQSVEFQFSNPAKARRKKS